MSLSTSDILERLNDNDSFLALYIPLAFWILTYVYCLPTIQSVVLGRASSLDKEEPTPSSQQNKSRDDWSHWTILHDFHNVGAIVLGSISLYYNDDARFNERIPILWSSAYYGVDVLDALYRKDFIYIIHGAFCFVLGLYNYHTPLFRKLRMNSKAAMCLLSNPLLHWAKHTRQPLHFGLFAIVYTGCRILWVPYMMKELVDAGMDPYRDARFLCLLAFYGLNCFWYYKILRIIVTGDDRSKSSKNKDS